MDGKVYVFGGKDGRGLRIFSVDEGDKTHRCGRLAMFFQRGDQWFALTSKGIFQRGWRGQLMMSSENVKGKVARAFEWKDSKRPADIADSRDDMVIDPVPVGEVVEEPDLLQVIVRIYPEWMAANKEAFETRGQWMPVWQGPSPPPGAKLRVGMT
jgi:hypothetical protein